MTAKSAQRATDIAPFPAFSDAEYARRFAAVRKSMAQDDIAALIIFGSRGREAVSVPYLKPGGTAKQVVDAVKFIEDEGYSIYDDLFHGYGGGYLPPVLRTHGTAHEPAPDYVFEENMTFVVQPNVITRDEKAGVQLGHLLRVTATGCESMHSFPRQFTIAGA